MPNFPDNMPCRGCQEMVSLKMRHLAPAFILFLAMGLCGCQLIKKEAVRGGPSQNPCLALALPASGAYAPIAGKIRKGAGLAVKELKGAGVNVRLENINTESPDWLKRLEALPPICAVVGGPLQDKTYMAARKAGELEKKVFFSFSPTLQKGDEGKRAWRFFPSPQDQIDALVNFGANDMNVRSYGAFYPDDNYGRRMSQMFERSLAGRHMSLRKASYSASAPASWSRDLASLIQPVRKNGQVTPQTTFEAIFIPDSWKNMDKITRALGENGEDRLILMGSTLWEQGLSGKRIPDAERYSLAVYPAAWDSARAPRSLRDGSNDFWVALGYDFVNFGVYVDLAERAAASEVTARARSASRMVKAMAPIHWDENGVARQHLYLFQITPEGVRPMNLDRFKKALDSRREKTALRLQGWGHINPDTGEALESAPPLPGGEAPVGRVIDPAAPPAPMEPGIPQDGAGVQAGGEAVEGEPAAASAPPAWRPHSSQVSAPAQEPAVAAPARRPAGGPDTGGGVMSSTPRPSYKLSLPGAR